MPVRRVIANTAQIFDHELSDGIFPFTYLVSRRLKHADVLHAQRISRANGGFRGAHAGRVSVSAARLNELQLITLERRHPTCHQSLITLILFPSRLALSS